MNLILCGLPMSGKTTIGKTLSQLSNKDFIDTDDLIENSYFQKYGVQLNCRQIYKKEGESYFRALETDQIASLVHVKNSIIAIGGGAVCEAKNVGHLKSLGLLIYLKMPLKQLWQRVSGCGIPAYIDLTDPEKSFYNPEKSFYNLMQERIPIIEAQAHLSFDCNQLNPHVIAESIMKKVEMNNHGFLHGK
jgi:shikimate kinase